MIRDHFLQRDIGITKRDLELVKGWSNQFTPDIAKLERYQTQNIFVCDEFMSDRRQHFVIEDDIVQKNGLTYKVVGFTTMHYNFLLHPDGQALPFPNSDGHKIKGEIIVTHGAEAIKKLDKLKMNGVQYRRVRVHIFDPYRPFRVFTNGWNDTFFEDGTMMPEALQGKKYEIFEELVHTQSAWMYLPDPAFWDYQVKRRPEIFNRVPTFQPKQGRPWLNAPYYKYQHPSEDR